MKRFSCLTMLVLTLLVICLPTSLPVSAVTGCTPDAMQGTYAFFASPTVVMSQGTVVAIPEALLANSPVMLASQGTVQVDGQGQVVLTATQDINGAAMAPTSYAGNYSMTDGCNATVTLDNGISFTVRLVDVNDQPQLLSTTPGFVLINNP